jgi:hypothetical protein
MANPWLVGKGHDINSACGLALQKFLGKRVQACSVASEARIVGFFRAPEMVWNADVTTSLDYGTDSSLTGTESKVGSRIKSMGE